MLVNKTDIFYSIRSKFAHADRVTSPKMAVGYMNTWISLRVSADSSWSLFSSYRLADLRIKGSNLIGLCDALGGLGPVLFTFATWRIFT